MNQSNLINQDNIIKLILLKKINIEINNNSKQLNSLKNLKEQIIKNQIFKMKF